MNETPILFPITPSEFWKQIKIIIENVIGEKLSQQRVPPANTHLPQKALLKVSDVCEIFQISKPTLVNNHGETFKDNWIGLRGKKIAQKLTKKYGLKEAVSKNLSLTNLEALNEREANRCIIYQAIVEKLPLCRSLTELKEKLTKENIETLYKYKGQADELQGISFKLGDYKYKGSEIDRKFSINSLQKILQRQQAEKLFTSPQDLWYSKNVSENKKLEINKSLNKELRILNELIRPEQNDQSLAPDWRLRKIRKKKSRGLHS